MNTEKSKVLGAEYHGIGLGVFRRRDSSLGGGGMNEGGGKGKGKDL